MTWPGRERTPAERMVSEANGVGLGFGVGGWQATPRTSERSKALATHSGTSWTIGQRVGSSVTAPSTRLRFGVGLGLGVGFGVGFWVAEWGWASQADRKHHQEAPASLPGRAVSSKHLGDLGLHLGFGVWGRVWG